MKYVLILTLCSFVEGSFVCNEKDSSIAPFEYDSWTNCILYGYKHSHNSLIKNYYERIEKEKLAIKFECKGVQVS